MPQNQDKEAVNGVIQQHRFSLQHKNSDLPLSNLRHTQSHRYDSDGKKKGRKTVILTPLPFTISEGSEKDTEQQTTENKFEKKSETQVYTMENEKRSSKSSKKNEKLNFTYDNSAYDSNLDKRSISSRAGSSRQPSIQSLEVVREQYCCCAKRTRCEKKLLVTVTVLAIVIIVLVIVLAIIANNKDIRADFKHIGNAFR